MAIQDRNLTPGTQLTVTYKGQTHTAGVVQTEQGPRYRLADGREFKSPSSAASAITNKSANGWAFWSLAGEASSTTVTPAPRPSRTRQPTTAAAKDGNGHTLPIIEQTDNSYECGECGSRFESREAVEIHLHEVHPA